MSLSECLWCGGHIPLGPDASNCCEKCGKHVMSAPEKTTTPREELAESAIDAAMAVVRHHWPDGMMRHGISDRDVVIEILAAGWRRGPVVVTDAMVRAFWEADDCEDCREWAFGYERTRHCIEAALAAAKESDRG